MVSRRRKVSRNKIDAILVPKYFVYRAIPCQLDQNFKGWPISGSDETFPDERYVWDKIILKISSQTDNSFKSYGTSNLSR